MEELPVCPHYAVMADSG